jgi:hypothetical protein
VRFNNHRLDPALLSSLPANEVKLLLGVMADNPGNLLRRMVLAIAIEDWSPTGFQTADQDWRAAAPPCAGLHATDGGTLLDRTPLSPDPRAHRATGLATDMMLIV